MIRRTLILAVFFLLKAASPSGALPPAGASDTNSGPATVLSGDAAPPGGSLWQELKGSVKRSLKPILDTIHSPGFSVFEPRTPVLAVLYPFNGTLFPRDMRSPEFSWDGPFPPKGIWHLRVSFKGSTHVIDATSNNTSWTPDAAVWDDIRAHALETRATFAVSPSAGMEESGSARIEFMISKDPAGAPIFFRAVPSGKTFPTEEEYVNVKWKIGWLSSYSPPTTVMKNQRLCFNCHAASANGKIIGFDYNPTPAYRSSYLFIRNPGKKLTFSRENTFDWNDYKRGTELRPFDANASAISPDGRVIATCGKALSFIVPNCTGSIQYTTVTRGIILYRYVDDPVLRALPGGDDENFVHYPNSWSPDGKYIYFSGMPVSQEFQERNRARLNKQDKDDTRRLSWKEFDKIYPLRTDVYRIPFAGGKGGRAEPLKGASANGRSNYFPRASPDGKWVVFVQADNSMGLIREDSDLYIIPAAGGPARKLRCNGPRGESWHSWSPNSRWLAFASKSYGPHTDIVLTHINEAGEDSPPVVLTQMRDEGGLSANLPEFFNLRPGQLEEIIQQIQ